MEPSALVSVLAWPAGMTEEDRALALSAATDLDLYLCRPRAKHEGPFIVARMAGERAREAAASLEAVGVRALAVEKGMMDAVPEMLKAKRLAAAEGAPEPMYLVEPWRGEAAGLRPKDVALIVIGRTDRSVKRISQDRSLGDEGSMSTGGPVVSTTSGRSFLLDLYMRGKRRLRIDSEKFSFDVLGGERGFTDAENFDKLCLRLGSECAGAIIDDGFERFRKLPELRKAPTQSVADVTVQRRDERPAFDFYSAWVYVVQMHLQRGAGK